jgi:hypothetical protein
LVAFFFLPIFCFLRDFSVADINMSVSSTAAPVIETADPSRLYFESFSKRC